MEFFPIYNNIFPTISQCRLFYTSGIGPVVFNDVGERHATKNNCPVSLHSVISKVFEKLVKAC